MTVVAETKGQPCCRRIVTAATPADDITGALAPVLRSAAGVVRESAGLLRHLAGLGVVLLSEPKRSRRGRGVGPTPAAPLPSPNVIPFPASRTIARIAPAQRT